MPPSSPLLKKKCTTPAGVFRKWLLPAARMSENRRSSIPCWGDTIWLKTSRTPGHTRKLNFFLINETFIFVDCPGYGYAAVPLEIKNQWGPMMETYFQERDELAGVVVVVDARLPLTEADDRMMRLVQSYSLPLIVAVTKADKLPHGKRVQHVRDLRIQIEDNVPVIIFSSHDGLGKNELWKAIKILIQ